MAAAERVVVITWGRGANGELGRGPPSTADVIGRVDRVRALDGVPVTHIACGLYHTLATTADGDLYAWGAGAGGQLGTGDGASAHLPRRVQALRVHRRCVRAACAGRTHTLAVGADGRLLAWGLAAHGQLGLCAGAGAMSDALEPRVVRPIAAVRAVAAGEAHSLALTADGGVYAWGSMANGRTGTVPRPSELGPHERTRWGAAPPAEWAPTRLRLRAPGAGTAGAVGAAAALGVGALPAPSVPIVCIAAGWRHSVAVSAHGQLFSWGCGASGQLGHGARADVHTPAPVEALARERTLSVAAGAAHTLALAEGELLFAWGDGRAGQLGTGDARSCDAPRLVEGAPARVRSLCAGAAHSVALGWDGGVHCCGQNAYGQLGTAVGGAAGGEAAETPGLLRAFTRVPLEALLGGGGPAAVAEAPGAGEGAGAGAAVPPQPPWRVTMVASGAWHCAALVALSDDAVAAPVPTPTLGAASGAGP